MLFLVVGFGIVLLTGLVYLLIRQPKRPAEGDDSGLGEESDGDSA